MRGDQLARPSGIIRVIEANSKGLAAAQIAMPDEAQRCGQNRSLSRAYSKSWDGLFYYGAAQEII